jgi:hypothetical protein
MRRWCARQRWHRVPWLRRPCDRGSVQHGCQSSREVHMAQRWLHVVSGAAVDGASARAHTHEVGHATRGCPDGACQYAAQPGHCGAVAAACLTST